MNKSLKRNMAKLQTPTKVAAVEVVEVVAPVVAEVVVEPVVEAETEVAEAEIVEAKVVVAKEQKYGLSSARVKKFMNETYINSAVSTLEKTLGTENKVLLKKLEAAYKKIKVKDVPDSAEALTLLQEIADLDAATQIKTNLKAIKLCKSRFSGDVDVCVAHILNEVVKQLLLVAFEQTILNKKKGVKISHLMQGDVSKVPLYKLIHGSMSYMHEYLLARETASEEQSKISETLLKKDMAKQVKLLVAAEIKKFKLTHECKKIKVEAGSTVHIAAAPVATPGSTVVVEAELEEEEEEEAKKRVDDFKYYIEGLKKVLSKTYPEYLTLRISKKLKKLLSDIVIDIINRTNSVLINILDCAEMKTITTRRALYAFNILLSDGCPCDKVASFETKTVVDKNDVSSEITVVSVTDSASFTYLQSLVGDLC